MQPSPRRPVVLVLVTAAAVIGSLGWARAADGSGPTATTVPRPSSSSTPPSPAGTVATGLDPGLVAAFDAVAVEARRAGQHLSITSGFRTVAEQEALLADAVAERGPTEALRWVFPPERSMHVRGLAVDVGDGDAATWLDHHGAPFGLCRTLAWEWWHFEWRAAWQASASCPGPVDDPADAPT